MRTGHAALEALTQLATAEDRPGLYARALAEGWLPFPLAPLLEQLAERRDSPEAVILHAPRFFEASYRFLAALVIPAVIRHGTMHADLATLVGGLLGAAPAGVVTTRKLSLGGYKDLFVEGLRAALDQRAALERLPELLQSYLAPARFAALNRVHSDFVCVRNAVHHDDDPLASAGAPALAEALERAALWWLTELAPLRDYPVVVSSPAAVVAPDGTLTPYQGEALPKGTLRYTAMLVHRDAFSRVRGAFQLPPFVSYDVGDREARARFLAPTGDAADAPFAGDTAVTEAAGSELSSFTQGELAELVKIVSSKGQRNPTARIETWRGALDRAMGGFARTLAVLTDAPEPFELGVYQPSPRGRAPRRRAPSQLRDQRSPRDHQRRPPGRLRLRQPALRTHGLRRRQGAARGGPLPGAAQRAGGHRVGAAATAARSLPERRERHLPELLPHHRRRLPAL